MRNLVRLLALIALIAAPSLVQAAPVAVNCPNSPDPLDREFTLTTDPTGATCYLYGNDANELNANQFDVMLDQPGDDWEILDKDQSSDAAFPNDAWFSVTGLGAANGSFTISSDAWDLYERIAIGFVVGGGQIDPKWAVFELPFGETSGLWSDVPQQGGGLSHANWYGILDDDNEVTEVPEPATMLLVGGGLLAAARRRRGKK